MSDPANDNWIHIADAIAIRALRRWEAWCDYAKLAEESATIRSVIELMTGTEAPGDGVGGSRTIAGKLPVLAPHE